jgi:hypothetical protein
MMKAGAKVIELLACICEVLCVGGSCHRRFAILTIGRPVKNLKFLRAKIEAQGASVDRMN